MQHWWVNQNQTCLHEIGGGHLWSPRVNSNGACNGFYVAMKATRVGDVVFSFCDSLVKAIGVVSRSCPSAPKPTGFGATGERRAGEGWWPSGDGASLKDGGSMARLRLKSTPPRIQNQGVEG